MRFWKACEEICGTFVFCLNRWLASRPEPTRIAQDVNLSVDLTATFRLTARRKCASTIDMSVNVLTASNWPTMTPTDVSLPPEIVELQTLFTEYYCSKHANRKLIWEPFLGHCLVHGNFEKGSKDLTMSIYQVRALTFTFSHDRGREKGCMRDHQVGSVAVNLSMREHRKMQDQHRASLTLTSSIVGTRPSGVQLSRFVHLH